MILIVAIMMVAPVFIPSALAVLGSGRAGTSSNISGIYELIYYIKLPIAFMNASADYYVALGYGAIGVLAVLLLFFKTKLKEKLGFKVAFALGTIFLLFPFFGHALNGFGYVTNRWIWAYCFAVSLIVVEMLPDMLCLSKGMKWILAGLTILFAVPTFYFRASGSREKLQAALIVLLLASVILVLAFMIVRKLKNDTTKSYMVIIVANIFLSMFGFYSPTSGDDIKMHGDMGAAWENITSGPLSVLDDTDTNEYENVRIDTSNLYFFGVRANSAMLYDVNSVSFYYSVINDNTNRFLHDLWIPMPYENRYVDLDSRAFLSSFMGVRYNIIKSGDEEYLPYGYSNPVQEKNGYVMYESKNALPLAYIYDTVMGEEEYAGLSAIQRQQALLQTAAIEESALTGAAGNLLKCSQESLQFSDTTSDYSIVDAHGLEILENGFDVKESGALITIETDSVNNAERYFAFDNLYYEGKKHAEIIITDGRVSKHFEVKSQLDNAYANIHNFLCNLGYSEQHTTNYTLTFGEPGIYTFNSLSIVNQPLEYMDKWISQRRETEVDYSFEEDSVSLTVKGTKDGLLYVSIPYSNGWKAKVDGKDAEIFKTNDFGIGICLTPGEHSVELRYNTPYLRMGIVLMVLGMLGCGIVTLCGRKRVGRE